MSENKSGEIEHHNPNNNIATVTGTINLTSASVTIPLSLFQELQSFEIENHQLKEKLTGIHTNYTKFEEDNKILRDQVRSVKNENKNLRNKIAKLKEENEVLKQELKKIYDKLSVSDSTMDKMKLEIELLKSEKDNRNTENSFCDAFRYFREYLLPKARQKYAKKFTNQFMQIDSEHILDPLKVYSFGNNANLNDLKTLLSTLKLDSTNVLLFKSINKDRNISTHLIENDKYDDNKYMKNALSQVKETIDNSSNKYKNKMISFIEDIIKQIDNL